MANESNFGARLIVGDDVRSLYLFVDGTVLWLLGGYTVSCITLILGAVTQVVSGQRASAVTSAVFAGLAVLLSLRLLPYLAS